MRNGRKMEQHPVPVRDKPAKERIAEEADTLFYHFGVNVPLRMIASHANTNQVAVLRHFGSRERLVSDFLKARMKDAEAEWREIERDHPNDPVSQLRAWMFRAEISSEEVEPLDPFQIVSLCSRAIFTRKAPFAFRN